MNHDDKIICEAKGLLAGEEYDNPEYTRALAELISRFTGLPYEEAASRIGVDYTKVHAACHGVYPPKPKEQFFNVMDCHVVYPPEHQDALAGKDFGRVLQENNMDIAGVMIEVTESGVVKIRPKKDDEGSFHAKLKDLINSCSIENGSNTPDFVLAKFLKQCLDAWDMCTLERDRFMNGGKLPRR